MLNWRALAGLLVTVMVVTAHAATGRVIKVLPHYLDKDGRDSLSPSLYERDAYQAQLRKNPAQCSALRFDVLWTAKNAPELLTLKLEIRSSQQPQPMVIERAVKPPGLFRRWSSVLVSGKEFTALGSITAWRASLWDGETLVGEERSFLW